MASGTYQGIYQEPGRIRGTRYANNARGPRRIAGSPAIQLDVPTLMRFEARREHSGLLPITIRDLLRATSPHQPERILVGEVRGGEAFELFQALNAGSLGTLSTIHANLAEQALHRFTSSDLQSGVDLSHPAIGPARAMLPPCPCIRRHGC